MDDTQIKKKAYSGNSYGVGMTVFRSPLAGSTVLGGKEFETSPRRATLPLTTKDAEPDFTELLKLNHTMSPADLAGLPPHYFGPHERLPDKFRQRLLLARGLDPHGEPPRRLPPMANWQALSSPRKLRQGLTPREKEAARSSRNGWLFRQNDLRYIRGVLTPECESVQHPTYLAGVRST